MRMHDAREYLKLANAIRKAPTTPPCMETDPELWFPVMELEQNNAKIAKAFCAGCPVQNECLTYALNVGEMHGIWGGLTPKNRQRLLSRGRARQASRPSRSRRRD